MRLIIPLQQLAGFGLLLSLGLGGCTAKDSVAPAATACSELVTVRFCPNCPASQASPRMVKSSLQLADGYYVSPIGATWQAYQAQQVDGQVLRVGYQLGPALGPNEYGLRTATITCLEIAD